MSVLLLGFLSVLAGCQTGILPDPNDPKDVGNLSADTVRRNLKWANLMLVEREAAHEITADESRDFIAKRAQDLLSKMDLAKVPDSDAWEYGEIFMTAKQWKEASMFLEQAVKHPVNEDRRINDTLRLAQVKARLGNPGEAIRLAQTTLNASEREGAPVLPAIYLEIAPVVKGKGFDAELAKLIVDATEVHKRVIVDESTDAGKVFVFAKLHHIRRALELAASLYVSSGHAAEAQKLQAGIISSESTPRTTI